MKLVQCDIYCMENSNPVIPTVRELNPHRILDKKLDIPAMSFSLACSWSTASSADPGTFWGWWPSATFILTPPPSSENKVNVENGVKLIWRHRHAAQTDFTRIPKASWDSFASCLWIRHCKETSKLQDKQPLIPRRPPQRHTRISLLKNVVSTECPIR